MAALDMTMRTQAERLLETQRAMLAAYLRHMVNSPHDAEDLLQDVCVAVLEKPALLLRGSDPGAYLRGIARHLSSHHHRRIVLDPVLESVMEVAWEQPEAVDNSDLKRCLGKLTGRIRQLLTWRYEELLNSTQIAERLKTTPDAVRMALARGRLTLAKCLEAHMAGPGEA